MEQGISYKALGEDWVLRTDLLASEDGSVIPWESFGIAEDFGTRYITPASVGQCIYSYERSSGSILFPDVTRAHLYYLEIEGTPIFVGYCSQDIGISDNRGSPTLTLQREDGYVIYMAPKEFTDSYCLFFHHATMGKQTIEEALNEAIPF